MAPEDRAKTCEQKHVPRFGIDQNGFVVYGLVREPRRVDNKPFIHLGPSDSFYFRRVRRRYRLL